MSMLFLMSSDLVLAIRICTEIHDFDHSFLSNTQLRSFSSRDFCFIIGGRDWRFPFLKANLT